MLLDNHFNQMPTMAKNSTTKVRASNMEKNRRCFEYGCLKLVKLAIKATPVKHRYIVGNGFIQFRIRQIKAICCHRRSNLVMEDKAHPYQMLLRPDRHSSHLLLLAD